MRARDGSHFSARQEELAGAARLSGQASRTPAPGMEVRSWWRRQQRWRLLAGNQRALRDARPNRALQPFIGRLKIAESCLAASAEPAPATVRQSLGNGVRRVSPA
jgi:hypothetical protein